MKTVEACVIAYIWGDDLIRNLLHVPHALTVTTVCMHSDVLQQQHGQFQLQTYIPTEWQNLCCEVGLNYDPWSNTIEKIQTLTDSSS